MKLSTVWQPPLVTVSASNERVARRCAPLVGTRIDMLSARVNFHVGRVAAMSGVARFGKWLLAASTVELWSEDALWRSNRSGKRQIAPRCYFSPPCFGFFFCPSVMLASGVALAWYWFKMCIDSLLPRRWCITRGQSARTSSAPHPKHWPHTPDVFSGRRIRLRSARMKRDKTQRNRSKKARASRRASSNLVSCMGERSLISVYPACFCEDVKRNLYSRRVHWVIGHRTALYLPWEVKNKGGVRFIPLFLDSGSWRISGHSHLPFLFVPTFHLILYLVATFMLHWISGTSSHSNTVIKQSLWGSLESWSQMCLMFKITTDVSPSQLVF